MSAERGPARSQPQQPCVRRSQGRTSAAQRDALQHRADLRDHVCFGLHRRGRGVEHGRQRAHELCTGGGAGGAARGGRGGAGGCAPGMRAGGEQRKQRAHQHGGSPAPTASPTRQTRRHLVRTAVQAVRSCPLAPGAGRWRARPGLKRPRAGLPRGGVACRPRRLTRPWPRRVLRRHTRRRASATHATRTRRGARLVNTFPASASRARVLHCGSVGSVGSGGGARQDALRTRSLLRGSAAAAKDGASKAASRCHHASIAPPVLRGGSVNTPPRWPHAAARHAHACIPGADGCCCVAPAGAEARRGRCGGGAKRTAPASASARTTPGLLKSGGRGRRRRAASNARRAAARTPRRHSAASATASG